MRQEEARVQIQIIDPPSIPYEQRGPAKVVLVAAGLGLGLVAGIGVALLLVYLYPLSTGLSEARRAIAAE
jgi:uncharacterized protein involved in exopolysaccharide biosynthesis